MQTARPPGGWIAKCRDCYGRSRVPARIWGFAASPRCFGCGGMLDQVEPYGQMKKKRKKRKRRKHN